MAGDNIKAKLKTFLGFGSEAKGVSLNDALAQQIFGIVPTSAGVPVTTETALRIPAVLQAVRLIAETCGSLPVKAYRDDKNGKEALKSGRVNFIVHKFANEWTSAGEFRTALTLDALISGHGFARVIRTNGAPFELHRLDPQKVTVLCDDLTGAPVYRVTENGKTTDYSHRDVLRISAFAGRSPITMGREAIGLAAVLEKHANQLFGSGARPGVMIRRDKKTPDGPAGEAVVKRLRAGYVAAASNGFKEPFIADDGWTVDQLSFSSTDSQFLEHRREQINEIARLFGIPPHMLFQLDRATWSNAEQMAASFLQLCLRPWLDRWQDAYNTVLFTEDELETHYCEFVIDDLQRADSAGRADIFTKLISARVMTPNEARATMNLPPLPGGDKLANPFTSTPNATGAAESQPAQENDAA